jgi:hypothetical protein
MIVTILAIATFAIDAPTRNFTIKYVFKPTGHACVRVERVIAKPFHKALK